MLDIKSSDLQAIFSVSRDDVRRLSKDGVLTPRKHGNGIADEFDEYDLQRMLDVKMFLWAGYKVSDMRSIFTDGYDPEKAISEQIHVYERRLKVLKFIEKMRSNSIDADVIGSEHQGCTYNMMTGYLDACANLKFEPEVEMSEYRLNVPKYGDEKFKEFFWCWIETLMLFDYFSQKGIDIKNDFSKKRIMDAHKLICEHPVSVGHI